MCIISFHFQDHPKYKLIVAANRDEFYQRPTKRAHYWDDEPNILAGRDLEANGTWLGMTKQGRFAALTNYRHVKYFNNDYKRSRGEIVAYFLKVTIGPKQYLEKLYDINVQFSVYNFIFCLSYELFSYFIEQLEHIYHSTNTL